MTNINRSNRCLISILSSHVVSIPLPVARIDRTPRSARTSHAAITAGVWRGQNCVIFMRLVDHDPDRRVEQKLQFADYDSLEASCHDYAWLITRGAPYAVAWAHYQEICDLPALIAAVAGTYATDPNYKALATSIAYQTNVAAAIDAARTVRA